jgi:hypothetical protein
MDVLCPEGANDMETCTWSAVPLVLVVVLLLVILLLLVLVVVLRPRLRMEKE